jgi:hypothetical protein
LGGVKIFLAKKFGDEKNENFDVLTKKKFNKFHFSAKKIQTKK